jgi:hypothetical protein
MQPASRGLCARRPLWYNSLAPFAARYLAAPCCVRVAAGYGLASKQTTTEE